MEGIRVNSPYEAKLEQTIQELNKRKKDLEDALHQVCFKAMSLRIASLKLINS